MSELENDLNNLTDEPLTMREVNIAIKILCEVTDSEMIKKFSDMIIPILFGPCPGIIFPSYGICIYMYKKCTDIYSGLPCDQRKVIAKFARKLHGILH